MTDNDLLGPADIQRSAECVRKHWPIEADRRERGEPAFFINPKIIDPDDGKIAGDIDRALTWSREATRSHSMAVYTAPPASRTVPNKDHILNIARECGIEAGVKVGFDDLYRFTEKILQA